MFKFPENLYTDVRIEDVFETNIVYTLGDLEESKIRKYKAAFLRVFDGVRWYYSSISDVNSIQDEINKLCNMAKPNANLNENPIVKKFEVNKGQYLKFNDDSIEHITKKEKDELLKSYFKVIEGRESIKMWKATYIDCKKNFEFYSSKGANLIFDAQRSGFALEFDLVNGDKNLSEKFNKGSNYYNDLKEQEDKLITYIEKCEEFLMNSKKAKPGRYTVVLSPIVAGVFAHESFGHKSESDFMVWDETMKREWAIGTKVGSDILSIVDSGQENGNGYVPFDDEGTKARKTYLIRDGVLTGRLHSVSTAAQLQEEVTGNARSMNYEFEPIVRMTSTYILPGKKSKEELFSEIKEGFYIETFKYGSGMSTFTIAPSLAYRIENGKIVEPVDISVITGNVFETLSEIDGLSNELEIWSSALGGCGKIEQYTLPVGFGGPYVRVRNMNVQ
ncbi:TldD/PmbA family protein [Clostridium frigidicarnis]|uniref:TldD protein n=1 Tax=Clostridium frigidicarnis TaxID=84698 RepID=A0A1I1A2A8_9CLOT|nr:TldD/PmbA family protein [Clostridium frigidicarnis]SFB30728.1 TldD protein [Clostridium frigidicarnis]